MINIPDSIIVGQTYFVGSDPTEWTCIGTAYNQTFLAVGMLWDQSSNRTEIKTHKLQEIRFKGKLPVKSS